MNIETARGIAGRVWCDQDMGRIAMDADLAEAIAKIVQIAARDDGTAQELEDIAVCQQDLNPRPIDQDFKAEEQAGG